MRKLGIACAFLLAAGVALAQEPSSGSSQMPDTGGQSHMDKTKAGKSWKAEVVSTDATARTITVKKSEGGASSSSSGMSSNEMTLSFDPSIESMLSSFSAGDQVRITTRKDSSGKEIVSKIERAGNLPASGDQPPKPQTCRAPGGGAPSVVWRDGSPSPRPRTRPWMAHRPHPRYLEDPKLTGDLTVARDFDLGLTGPPMFINIDFIAGSLVEMAVGAAIVGENGAGKTTLVKLLCRLYEPTSGRILVDGAPLDRMLAEAWRSRLAGAFQDFFRFELAAGWSVGVGDLPRLDDAPAVLAAVSRAGAEDVLSRLPGGVEVSFGQ